MTRRKRIQINETPAYPTDFEAKYYATMYRRDFLQPEYCRLDYQRWEYKPSIDILCTWGCNGIFFVFSYPPAGFVISKPEDVLDLQTFEGWIFEYQAQNDLFNLLVKASRDGIDFFWKRHRFYSK